MDGVAIGYPAEFGGGQYGICGQLYWQNGLFRLAQKLLSTWANWARQLHSNAEANRTLLAGEIGPQ
jgi:hypothetical protein